MNAPRSLTFLLALGTALGAPAAGQPQPAPSASTSFGCSPRNSRDTNTYTFARFLGVGQNAAIVLFPGATAENEYDAYPCQSAGDLPHIILKGPVTAESVTWCFPLVPAGGGGERPDWHILTERLQGPQTEQVFTLPSGQPAVVGHPDAAHACAGPGI